MSCEYDLRTWKNVRNTTVVQITTDILIFILAEYCCAWLCCSENCAVAPLKTV